MEIKYWLEFAKAQREIWEKISSKNKDMPPYVISENNNQCNLMVIAPQVDRDMALSAAHLMRTGLASDAMTIITDGYTVRKEQEPRLANRDMMELYQELNKKYGSLQDAFKDGRKEVIECLNVIHYYSDGHMSATVVEYWKDNGSLIWGEALEINEGESEARLGGIVPDSLRKLMKDPTLFELEDVKKIAERLGIENKDRQLYHAGRAVRKFLHDKNFLVLECVAWEPNEGHEALLHKMKEKLDETKDIYDINTMRSKIPSPSNN